MDKKRLIAEGAVQQSKDEATIQVISVFHTVINHNFYYKSYASLQLQ